jgi:hypothetical protein
MSSMVASVRIQRIDTNFVMGAKVIGNNLKTNKK